MNKIFNKKNINNLLIIVSIIYYIYLMFFSNVTLDTGKKELENILLLVIPSFMLLFYSFNLKAKEERKRILIIYLLFYLLTVVGFTFANFRDNLLINKGISNRGYNLIPFISIKQMLISPLGLKVGLYNIIGNFLMLTPLAILLPLIFNRFKKVKSYIKAIILFSLTIEILQYITKTGSFDVDDLILNIAGSFIFYLIIIKTKLHTYLYKLFYEVTIPKNILNTIYYTLLVLIFIIYLWYSHLIYTKYKEMQVDFTNLKCTTQEKTYLGNIGKYNYYSLCKLEGYVKKGNVNISINDLVKRFGSSIDNYSKELKLIKEEAITNVMVKLSKGTRKLIYTYQDIQKVYLIDIEKISYYKNGIECVIEDTLPSDNKDCNANLVTVTKSDITNGYVISEGEYYNELSCITSIYHNTKYTDYILPKDYELNEDSCTKLSEK